MRTLIGLVQACHPFPLLTVVGLTGLVALTAPTPDPPLSRISLLVFAMFLSQLAIGWTNDYVDRKSDTLHQPSKPLARGLVPAQLVLALSVVALASALCAGAFLGRLPIVFLLIGTAAGLAYNLGLKNTPLSWLPYVAAFAVLPPFVWTALHSFRDDLLWLYLIGTPLTVAAHFANTLPDVKADREAGRRSIVTILGYKASLAGLFLLLLGAAGLLIATLVFIEIDLVIVLSTIGIFTVLLAMTAIAYSQSQPLIGFRLVALASVALVIGWLWAIK